MSITPIRTDPPSNEPNNQDVFVWALYLLGGADRDVDVEDIYLKCFELAPARLGWRTRPDLPDYKKTSKALQSIEATTHVGLLHRPHQYSRRLTLEGIKWVEQYLEILKKNYSHAAVQASKTNNVYERLRTEIRNGDAWTKYLINPDSVDISDAAAALRCSPASPQTTWLSRTTEIRRAADVLKDDEIMEFADFVQNKFVNRLSK
jgi:hypothetical protein